MQAILILLLLTSVITDLTQGRIYNMLVFPAMSAGVLLRLEQGGIQALVPVLLSLGFPLVLLPFHYIRRGLGGGDIKLLMAVASLMDCRTFLSCLMLSFMVSSVLAFLTLAVFRDRRMTVPMAVPVAAGTMAVMAGLADFPLF